MAEKDAARDYKEIRQDYAFDPDIMNDEPERVARVKYIVNNRLNQVDRTLIILYADCQSYRKLGKRLGLSHTTVAQEINRIKAEIRRIYDELKQQER
jgi:TyrR family helix-turn-helix protein